MSRDALCRKSMGRGVPGRDLRRSYKSLGRRGLPGGGRLHGGQGFSPSGQKLRGWTKFLHRRRKKPGPPRKKLRARRKKLRAWTKFLHRRRKKLDAPRKKLRQRSFLLHEGEKWPRQTPIGPTVPEIPVQHAPGLNAPLAHGGAFSRFQVQFASFCARLIRFPGKPAVRPGPFRATHGLLPARLSSRRHGPEHPASSKKTTRSAVQGTLRVQLAPTSVPPACLAVAPRVVRAKKRSSTQ